jgi:hypothetical protein
MRYAAFFLALGLISAGCDSNNPVSPTHGFQSEAATTLPPVVKVPPPAQGASGTLAITTFEIGPMTISNGFYLYEPPLILKETEGLGPVTIRDITFTRPDGNSFILGFAAPLSTVSRGGYWEMTPAQYYLQEVEARAPLTSLKVTVSYWDEAGTLKSVSATATAGPPATLEVTSFAIGPSRFGNGFYYYYPQLELKETTGVGGASVTSLMYVLPGGDRQGLGGAGCSFPSRVAPGGTWNISAVYLYCQDVDARTPIQTLTVIVSYTDTAGNAKTVSATATTTAGGSLNR